MTLFYSYYTFVCEITKRKYKFPHYAKKIVLLRQKIIHMSVWNRKLISKRLES